jgi:uncharacterized protein (DUF2252 family)
MTEGNGHEPVTWTPEERIAQGRAARARVRRSTHGEWMPPADRRGVVEQLAEQETTRVQSLVPIRHERMAVSPFTFYRGAANVMAADLSGEPDTGLQVQLCGDAHLANFGGFATPERTLIFDINDFDETLPGPFEWDLKRLAASFEVAARSNEFSDRERRTVLNAMTLSYVRAMHEFSLMSNLDIWYTRLTTDDLARRWGTGKPEALLANFRRLVAKAETKNRLKAMNKLTTVTDGEVRFRSDPPLLQPVSEIFSTSEQQELHDTVVHSIATYRRSLQPDRRAVLERYRFVDLARKVVGVGSVGTRCWVALMMGRDGQDPLFIQVKEAERSVMEPYLGASRYEMHGRRVVEGQRMMQSASDIFLGWDRVVSGVDGRDHDYYFRQLWDWKVSAEIDTMTPIALTVYGQACGYTLARAHARTGDPIAIAAYLGGGKSIVRAMRRFATVYADQNERDHAEFVSHLAAKEPAAVTT